MSDGQAGGGKGPGKGPGKRGGSGGRRGGSHRGGPRRDGPARRPAPEGHDARREALRLLIGVLEDGRMLADLAEDAPAGLAPADRARARSLAALTLRRIGQADAALKPFLRSNPPGPARAALRMAAAEAHGDGGPVHAVVDGAVSALRSLGAGGLSGLVNAVARKACGPDGLAAWEKAGETANAPGWLRDRLEKAWGKRTAQAILRAQLSAPPLDLTPHPRADAALLAADMGAELLPCGSLRLARQAQVSALPGFDEGAFWVQDAAAAQPARVLAPQKGERILDLCAAPGGKTMQLAAAGAEVTALDISDRRLERVAENLARTGLSAEIVCVDAQEWSPDAPFDAILLDAPCSASGTVRRHPDLPQIKQGKDVEALTALQDALLEKAWSWLRPGGRLVFATCSLFPEEGEARIAAFLERHADATRAPVDPAALGGDPDWATADGDLRLRPDFLWEKGGMDGFFAADLRKRG
ncbi:transcription antitermination factor NusB [Rhodovulum sp. DZ06]|uniref:transcription antitermination factor NusB n=1 Tax=Rhodovulum sp. DZ06 TaxID=3425126 RepID=UPI003D34C982